MKTPRLFWKLYASYLTITLLSLVAVYILSSGAIGRFSDRQTAQYLKEQALLISQQIIDDFSSMDQVELNRIVGELSSKTSARLTFILPDGTVAGDTDKASSEMGNHRNRPEILEALNGHLGQSVRYSNTLKKNMMYIAVPVAANDIVYGIVRAAMPVTEMDQVLDSVHHRIFLGGMIILVLSALLSLIVSRRISQPLERIKAGAKRFADGDFSFRLHTIGSTEISSLSETMNLMAEQLEERIQSVIRERNQREAVLSSMEEGVLAVDTEGLIISLNKAASKFFQVLHPETAPGRSIEEVFRNVKLQKFIGSVLKGQEPRECELTARHSETYDLKVRGTNLLGMQGARIGAVVVFTDVSRLRRLESLRSDFVANVSHELKTPITSIKGFIETLLDGAINDPEEADRFLRIVAKHADRLNAIIDDLLTLSRLEQGDKEEMDLQKVGLAGLMNSAVEVCTHRASKKNITISTECPDHLSVFVNPPLIEQALINLISNAVKYSAENKDVAVCASAVDDGVLLSVKDSGYGIASEHLERLFERFYRIDKGRSRQEGGTGLGLAIVKHIAQAHGGAVSVESIFGKGSTFSILIPSEK
ncbi:ATP-binding protein [Tichowtungia aerotolerans]|uniref:histidine kinase n=1 Tax=Tichowtungia aerotolerans TaxID=2697043 RepID=A0A6P1MH79_9BACT|nr:ATP-binding protein [Tichowtungia aerotolerans]QHI70435.1 HAMP domain-containing protein [Tichowtungia aerotolerans]